LFFSKLESFLISSNSILNKYLVAFGRVLVALHFWITRTESKQRGQAVRCIFSFFKEKKEKDAASILHAKPAS
jgi:hypothetical protein